MPTTRYFIAQCSGFDDLGNAYVLIPNGDDYADQSVDLEPCFFGPALPPVQPDADANPDLTL